jgi:lipoprotein-anchoring transpeptidase ErfK/SrfK
LSLQKARRLSGASLLTLIFVSGPTPGAQAQERYYYIQQGQHQRLQGPPPRIDTRREMGRRQTARPSAPAPKQAEKPAPPPAGPHLLIVSVKSQKVSFYANGKLTSQSPVSTGTVTHPTPHGVFSIIQRNRHHRSNIYSGAPMPYMQRLTWSGIALHQGALPGYAASHGCIRLPEQYANYLWNTIKMNTRVIVSREDIAPFDVAHALLFQPKPAAATVQSVPELRKTLDTTQVRVRIANVSTVATDGASERVEGEDPKSAEASKPEVSSSSPAMRDLTPSVERARSETRTEMAEPAQTDDPARSEVAAPLQPAMPSGPELAGQDPAKEPVAAEIKEAQPETTATVYPQHADIPAPILASFAQSLEAKQRKAAPSGNVTVFISRKDKRLYVRQHFIPLFSAPVTFKDDTSNFGTHVFTALEKEGSERQVRWIAITMPAEMPKAPKVKTRIEYDRRGRPIEVPVKPLGKAPEPLASLSATAVLDRIEIAPDVVERISEYVTPGASLIVSDHGLGGETGLYTDFIVVTQK